MGGLLRGELGGWMTMTDRHWKEHRPKTYCELQRAGRLPAALEDAARRTAAEMDQLMEAGFTYQQAWEAVREDYMLLPAEPCEEEPEENSTGDAYELLCQMIDLRREIEERKDKLQDANRQPSTREILDHVEKKIAEGSRAKRSVLKKYNRDADK